MRDRTQMRAPPQLSLRKPGSKIKPPSICIFGKGGAGKTTSLATMPGRGLVIETPQPEGGGDLVLMDYADRIEVQDVLDWNEIDDVFWFLKSGSHHFQWVAFDTLTGLKQLAIRRTIKDRDLDDDPHKITQPEWGKVGQMVGELVYKFTTLPLPMIWLAQERNYGIEQEDGTKITLVGPEVTPASLAALMPVLLFCGRMSAVPSMSGEGWERRLRIGPSERFMTKTRTVSPNTVIPQQIRIGSPPVDELYKLQCYFLGQKGITLDDLDVVHDDSPFILSALQEVPDSDSEGQALVAVLDG